MTLTNALIVGTCLFLAASRFMFLERATEPEPSALKAVTSFPYRQKDDGVIQYEQINAAAKTLWHSANTKVAQLSSVLIPKGITPERKRRSCWEKWEVRHRILTGTLHSRPWWRPQQGPSRSYTLDGLDGADRQIADGMVPGNDRITASSVFSACYGKNESI